MSSDRTLTVGDVMIVMGDVPVVGPRALFKEAIELMTARHLGIACIVDERATLLGIITDGDLRRKLLHVQKPLSALLVDDARTHAVQNPVTTTVDASVADAVTLMDRRHVWDLPVVDAQHRLVGLLHLHPAIEAVLKELQQ